MRLIDEIEAAAKRTAELGQLGLTPTVEQADAYALVHYDKTYWPRIKAALLAGEEMAKHLSIDPWKEDDDDVQAMLARFRAATEGTK